MSTTTQKFFQNEKKFKVGEFYETIMVKSLPYYNIIVSLV